MLWFIFCIAVLNMAAGFVLAVFLAGSTVTTGVVRCEDLPDDSHEDDTFAEINNTFASEPATDDQAEDDQTEDEIEPPVSGDPEEEAGDELADPAVADEPGDSSDHSVMADLDAAVSAALGDAPLLGDEEEPRTSDATSVEDNRTEASLQAYQSQLEDFCEELAALDDRLRTKLPENSSELIAELESMVECNDKQTATCQEVEQSLRSMMDAEVIDDERGEAILAAIREERQEASATAEAFEQVDLEGDAGVQCDEVLDRTAKLLGANHELRDQVSDMIAATQCLEDAETTNAGTDTLTELMSRSALDTILAEHWEKDPHRARAVSLTVLDIDYFTKLNRNYGPSVGNRMLRALAQLLENEVPSEYHVARFAGQRFALLAIDRDLKQAVSETERVRQTIETVHFEHGERDIELTASCGVVTADRNDTQDSFYGRAVESVQEAKRYGRNRTFVHEGEYPTPVVPPNFALTEKHVTI